VAGEKGTGGVAVALSDGIIARIDMDRHGLATVSWLQERL
jgi:hypothetical protein